MNTIRNSTKIDTINKIMSTKLTHFWIWLLLQFGAGSTFFLLSVCGMFYLSFLFFCYCLRSGLLLWFGRF